MNDYLTADRLEAMRRLSSNASPSWEARGISHGEVLALLALIEQVKDIP